MSNFELEKLLVAKVVAIEKVILNNPQLSAEYQKIYQQVLDTIDAEYQAIKNKFSAP